MIKWFMDKLLVWYTLVTGTITILSLIVAIELSINMINKDSIVDAARIKVIQQAYAIDALERELYITQQLYLDIRGQENENKKDKET